MQVQNTKQESPVTLLCMQFEHERAPSAHRIYLIYFPPLLSTNGMLFARFGNAKLNVRLIECEVGRI